MHGPDSFECGAAQIGTPPPLLECWGGAGGIGNHSNGASLPHSWVICPNVGPDQL